MHAQAVRSGGLLDEGDGRNDSAAPEPVKEESSGQRKTPERAPQPRQHSRRGTRPTPPVPAPCSRRRASPAWRCSDCWCSWSSTPRRAPSARTTIVSTGCASASSCSASESDLVLVLGARRVPGFHLGRRLAPLAHGQTLALAGAAARLRRRRAVAGGAVAAVGRLGSPARLGRQGGPRAGHRRRPTPSRAIPRTRACWPWRWARRSRGTARPRWCSPSLLVAPFAEFQARIEDASARGPLRRGRTAEYRRRAAAAAALAAAARHPLATATPSRRCSPSSRRARPTARSAAAGPGPAAQAAQQQQVRGGEAADARRVVVRGDGLEPAVGVARERRRRARRGPSPRPPARVRSSSFGASPKRGPTCERSTRADVRRVAPPCCALGRRAARRRAPRPAASSRGRDALVEQRAVEAAAQDAARSSRAARRGGAAGRAPGTRSSARRGAPARRGRRSSPQRLGDASTNAVSHSTRAERRLEVLARERERVARAACGRCRTRTTRSGAVGSGPSSR